MDIESLFNCDGALAAAQTQYELRPAQIDMARAVLEALEKNKNLVVEAGTGVGKSLGYLLPAALWAAAGSRRVLVSTHTRALQEQLLDKELPAVARVLTRFGHTLRYAMLMGADNYLCVQRLSRLLENKESLDASSAHAVDILDAWSRTAESGHRSCLPELVAQGLWGRINRDTDVCLGVDGPYAERCLYRKDRERAERAQILVVNHALLLSGARLPPHDALIIDEAHNLEDAAVSHYGLRISQGRCARLWDTVREVTGNATSVLTPLINCAREFEVFLKDIALAHGLERAATEPGGKLLTGVFDTEKLESIIPLETSLLAFSEASADEQDQIKARLALGSVTTLRTELKEIAATQHEDIARWVEWTPFGIELHSAPLVVGQRLAQGLFARDCPVILTSATLSTGDGLKEFKTRVGLEGARELVLNSPFDYRSQAALLLVDGMPDPSEKKVYIDALVKHCLEIIARVPGGIFILFSSWKILRRVHEILRRKVKGRSVWAQGVAGSDALLADFTQAGNAVLLGVDTFWQGVDVPGEALSCVVLTKLPFPSFGAPIEEARRAWHEAAGRGYFESYSLPRAIMKFRQGFGRLIRNTTDRGAVVVLDSRLLHRGYGAAFIEALPSCKRLESMDELGIFFGSKLDKPKRKIRKSSSRSRFSSAEEPGESPGLPRNGDARLTR